MILESTSAMWTAIADHVWQSTLFAATVAILSVSLKKNSARLRYRLWLAASLKFLIPFSLLISLGNHLAMLHRSPEMQAGFSFVVQRVSQPFPQTPHLRAPLFAFLAVLWLGGFVTTTVLCWLRWRRVAVSKRNAIPLPQGREVDALRHMERLGGYAGRLRSCYHQIGESLASWGSFGRFCFGRRGSPRAFGMRTWRLFSPTKCSMCDGATIWPPCCT